MHVYITELRECYNTYHPNARVYLSSRLVRFALLGCGQTELPEELDGFPLACPACGGLDLELLRGEELLVDALELEDATTNGGARYGR